MTRSYYPFCWDIYLLVNMLTGINRDVKDLPNGWIATVVLGDCKGGDLFLPHLHFQIKP